MPPGQYPAHNGSHHHLPPPPQGLHPGAHQNQRFMMGQQGDRQVSRGHGQPPYYYPQGGVQYHQGYYQKQSKSPNKKDV